MKHIARNVIGAALVCALAACTPTHARQTPEAPRAIVADLESKTVALVMSDGEKPRPYCSGVWVADDAFLTANHCTHEADIGERFVYVAYGDLTAEHGNTVETVRFGELANRDAAHDLALIRVRLAPSHGVASVNAEPCAGEPAQTMGHPLGLWWSYSTGTVAALRMLDDDGVWWVQATAPISPGNSGGGLFDTAGNLIGIAHGYLPRGQNVNLFVHPQYVAAFLRRAES